MEAYLQTEDLAVGYQGRTLIGEISLAVQRGRIVTLIGPNGSGKSTILKTIAGQLPRIGGAAYLDGEELRACSRNAIARRMAILMTARMDPELMTCRDVVSSGRYPYTGKLGILTAEDRKIVDESLRRTDAEAFADRPFQAVSDGQRQRILLARALCQQPELIVLDEPTSYLDIRYKLELLTILKRMVREEDLAVLMSLHELDLARRVSDTVVCVAGDHIDRVGPPEEIFTRDYIAKLYHMEPGRYDPCFSTKENRDFLCCQRRPRRPGAADAAGGPDAGAQRCHCRAADSLRPYACAGYCPRGSRSSRKKDPAAGLFHVDGRRDARSLLACGRGCRGSSARRGGRRCARKPRRRFALRNGVLYSGPDQGRRLRRCHAARRYEHLRCRSTSRTQPDPDGGAGAHSPRQRRSG